MFHTLIKQGFLTNQSAQGPIYILIPNWTRKTVWLLINKINMKKNCVEDVLNFKNSELTSLARLISGGFSPEYFPAADRITGTYN